MISMISKHVKIGDTVRIIAGAQKGVIGAILSIDKSKSIENPVKSIEKSIEKY